MRRRARGGGGRLTADPTYRARYRDRSVFTTAAAFTDLADELAVHPATLAVASCGPHPAVTAPLIGGRSVEQLEPSLAAAELEIDDDLRARISSLTPEPPPATDRSEEQAPPHR